VPDVEHAVSCPQGGVHEFVYQGDKSHWYRCIRCGDNIGKERLKDETDRRI
jgi:hypothetical protein